MHFINKLLSDPTLFIGNILTELKAKNIDVRKYPLDHICYRTDSIEQYLTLKNKLNQLGELLTESHINGRPIATIKLFEPIVFENRKIYLLEIPSPKIGSYYPAGFEHAEFVIDESLAAFMARYPNIDFDKKGLSKKVNPEVRIKFADFSVKFHLYDLEYVIKYLD